MDGCQEGQLGLRNLVLLEIKKEQIARAKEKNEQEQLGEIGSGSPGCGASQRASGEHAECLEGLVLSSTCKIPPRGNFMGCP